MDLIHLFNRPEPEVDQQPLCLEHLQDMGRGVSRRVMHDNAYGALLVIAASRVVVVDAYTHGDPKHGGAWVLEVHGAYPWQEPRFSPEQWQAFYEVHLAERYAETMLTGEAWLHICRHLATLYPNGQLASAYDRIVDKTRNLRDLSGVFYRAHA